MSVAIALNGVTVGYRSYREKPNSLKETMLRIISGKGASNYKTLDALKNISLDIQSGEILGIIGGNGSGKSTMLKVMTQVLKPTAGRVSVNGSVASLIELGVGFDPELNAIENIYLNASLHRKTKAEARKTIDKVIDFAELSDFVYTPIKYYSSGMAARLGFSAAIDINPDILLIDEILGVGDERFQKKCEDVFKGFFKSGKTIVLVSHSMELLEQLCTKILLLSRGEMAYLGDPATAIEMYRSESYKAALH